jgi:Domain of unknown function (DUF1905)
MAKTNYIMKETMFLYPGETANWHFLPVTKKYGLEIKAKYAKNRRGFGSLPVEVTIGETIWLTSIFPSKQSSSYILPIKSKVRLVEGIQAGEKVEFSLKIMV